MVIAFHIFTGYSQVMAFKYMQDFWTFEAL